MPQILPIFATPLCLAKFTDIDHLYNLTNNITEAEYGEVGKLLNQSQSSEILSDNRFLEVRTFIETCLENYSKLVYNSEEPLSITQSWLNKSYKGGGHLVHHHYNSLVSGVFYLKAVKGHPHITFHKNPVDALQPHIDNTNIFTSSVYHQQVRTGDLLLFPSTLQHHVVMNTIDTPRISLSFNTWLYGSIGSKDTYTYLTTKK